MRIGDLLLREGIVTEAQIDRALGVAFQQQLRLGSALVQLGYVDVDTLSRALSGLHRVPAALTKHVEAIEPSIIALFPARIAITHRAIPLGFTQTKPPRLVVALQDPTTTTLEEMTFAAGTRLDVSVMAESLVTRCLVQYYGFEVPVRGPRPEIDGVDLEPDPLQLPSVPPPRPEPPILTLSAPPPPLLEPPPPPAAVLEPVPELASGRAVEVAPPTREEEEPPPPKEEPRAPKGPSTAPPGALTPVLGVDEAIEALRTAATRDAIGDTLSAWLQSAWGFGLVLIVKDDLGMALGWRGYASEIEPSEIETIAMPLGPASMLTSAYEGKVSFRGPPPEKGAPIHRKLWNVLKCAEPREVLVIPVLLGERVVNILYSHVTDQIALGESALEDAARVAAATSTAYARIIRQREVDRRSQ